jgi:DNA-binding NarL/FixJ family response regulator
VIDVVIVDDQELVRFGFRMILEVEDDIVVIGEAGTGTEAVTVVTATRPDIVLMDIRMPDGDGIEATSRITAAHPATRVVLLTTFDLDDYVYAGLRAGASGFLLKDAPPTQLLHAIRTVAAGEAVLAPSATRRLLDRFVPDPGAPGRPSGAERLGELTDREREVFVLVARARSNREIANALHLSEGTVKVHVSRILGKLGLRDRVQVAVLAYESGIVTPGGDQS